MEALTFAAKLTAELIPLFLLISTLVYVVVDKLTPARIRAVLGGRSRWLGVPVAAGLGALTPFCSCSTVPLVNGMRTAGIPTASLVAFLIASPLINPVAVALLATAVGASYALGYAAAGVAFAIVAGVVVDRWYGDSAGDEPVSAAPTSGGCSPVACAPPARPATPAPGDAMVLRVGGGLPLLATASGGACCAAPAAAAVVEVPRLVHTLRAAFAKAVSDLRKLWIPLVLAIGVGAVVHGYVPADLLARIAGPERVWAIPAAALLGVPVYASIVVLLPLGASLLAKGVGVGAVTAFLMGASGFSLPEGILLSRVLPRALLLRVLAVFTIGVIAIGYSFQWLAG